MVHGDCDRSGHNHSYGRDSPIQLATGSAGHRPPSVLTELWTQIGARPDAQDARAEAAEQQLRAS